MGNLSWLNYHQPFFNLLTVMKLQFAVYSVRAHFNLSKIRLCKTKNIDKINLLILKS